MRNPAALSRSASVILGTREIAASIGAGKTTVYEILARAEAAGLSWPLPIELDEDELQTTLYPPPTVELAERRPVPNWREVHRELKRKRHVTLRLLWLEWKEVHPEGWGYTQFCWHYREWLSSKDVVMRLSYAAGERMFVDFSGDKMEDHEGRSVRGRARLLGSVVRRGDEEPGPAFVDLCPRARLELLRRRRRGHRAG
jgi:hypothetical protein